LLVSHDGKTKVVQDDEIGARKPGQHLAITAIPARRRQFV
jgi:hypothetical protein